MATIEITELETATSFAAGDLALIRKSAETKDRKITQANLIKSIGNPAVKGFIASSDEANKVILNPSNGTVIDTYYDAMEITFIAPINSTGMVQIKIGTLPYKDLLILGTNTTAQLSNGASYVQAYYNQTEDKFYQTNSPTAQQAYSSFYIAEGVVAGDESTTTYNLTSSFGLTDQNYYAGMGIIFTADVASKGGVLVNIDGLGNKTLTDKVGDKIANDLQANQVILAIYDGNSFIKSYFSEEVPEAAELPAEAFNEEGEIIPENIPEDNKLIVTVGNSGNTYTTLSGAIKDLIDNFGKDGGNRLVTINLSATYVWNERICLDNKDLSWITINASTVINVTVLEMLTMTRGSKLNLTGSYRQDTYAATTNYIYVNTDCELTIKNANLTSPNTFKNFSKLTMENVTFNNIPNKGAVSSYFDSSSQTIFTNVTFNLDKTGNGVDNGFRKIIIYGGNGSIWEGVTINSNYTASGAVEFHNSQNFIMNNVNINCASVIRFYNTNFSINNCNFTLTGTNTHVLNLQNSSGLLKNVNVRQGLASVTTIISEGSQVTIDGGNYIYDGVNSSANDVSVQQQGTIITLKNNPLGSFTTVLGAVIIND